MVVVDPTDPGTKGSDLLINWSLTLDKSSETQ